MSANCPGFRPHSVRATRCRRCFRDYSEHKPEQLGSVTDVSGGFSRINKTTSVSSNVSGGLGESTKRGSYSSGLDRATEIPKSVKEVTVDATISLPRSRKSDTNSQDISASDRTPSETKANDEKKPESTPTTTGKPPVSASKPPLPADTVVRPRTRSRPLSSVASVDEDSSSATERRRRPNSWASDASDSEAEGGSSTVTGRRRRNLRSASMSDGNESDSSVSSSRVRRVQILAAKEVERKQPDLGDRSQELTSPDVEFILRVKTSAANMKEENDETDSVAATETTEATETTLTCPDNMVEDLQNQVASLKSDLESAQLKCTKLEAEKVKLEKEKKDIIEKRKVSARDKEALEKTASEVLKLKTKVNELQTNKEDLTDENKVLKLEVKELQAEVDKRETSEKVKSELNTVKNKLSQAETLCEELMEENEELKKEMKEMEEELEELHDNFREDQANEYLDLKKELETTTKNCRVLQFKLRKTERRCEQLESEKSMLDEKVKDLQATGKIDADKTKMKELEVEVNVAKEVSLKMHSELESLKETVRKAEGENERLRQQLMNLPAGEKSNHVIPSAVELPSLTKDASGKSYEAVVRDLYDTMERETDMREQLRFAEDEIKTMRRKLSSLEQENETVVMQLKKMANARSKGGSAKKDEDELSPEELKLQFELCEQEMFVLRKRVDELEHENESLNSEVKYLQDKLVNQPLTTVELPELPPSEKTGPTVYYEQKIKLLEFEARELRRKLVEKERENERLQTEVEVHRRKASKVMVRSRSLDSEFQVDLKRQLQLVEQEATILRQKTMDLETENDKLQNENKRFQLRLSRKPPPGPADLMQLENMELKDKVTELNRKLNTLKDELVNAADGQVISATVLQEYKPKKETSSGGGTSGGSGTSDMENQLIAGLKKTVKAKDDEVVSLQAKITQIEVENSKLNRDYKKLKDTLNYKKRPMRPVRETATRMELKELIKDLEDEVSDLQVTVRGREIVQENLREELEKTKAQLDSTQKDFAQKEEKLTLELSDLRKQTETLRNEAKNEKLKAASWESQVKRLAEAQGTDLNLLEKAQSYQTEKDAMQKRIKEIEGKLKKEQEKTKDTEEKLKAVTSMKDELTKGSKILETQKKELEDALQEKRSQYNKAQEQIKNLKKKMDEKEKDFTAKFKEYAEIKNELEDERSKLKKHDNRQSEVAVGWLKEREELKKVLADIRAKAESLQVQMGTQETEWKEKEAKLKEEHAKKLEKAVKEARQQMEADVKQATNEEKAQKAKVADLTDQLDKLEKSLKESQEKVRHLNNQHRKDRDEWQTAEIDLENKLRAEMKKRERMEKENDQEKRQKDQEIIALKDKIFQLEREQRRASNKLDDIVSANESRIKELERELDQERQEYDEMTNKYEVLEEEFLSVKSRLVTEKEQVQANFGTIKRDYEAALAELKSLRDAFNVRQDNWIKERLDLNDTIKKMQIKIDRLADVEQDKLRLKDTVIEKNKVIESYKKEERHLRDERDKLKKSVDELKKRCTELERLEKASRAKVEVAKEAQDLKNKLGHNETTHKGELATMRVEYEGRIRMMSQEMQSMQSQIAELARDREVLIAKLEDADDMVEQIKNSSLKRERVRGREEVDVVRRKAEDLQRQLQNVMERYEAAELESKRLRVQLEAEKNNYQVQIGDLKSKINQYEEKNMLDSTRGSTRGYTKTRLELAWDKERTDQQKLLQDTQALVNELKDKVVTIETLRDKEKQEARKQIMDLNDLLEMEEQANKRKWNETQAQMTELKESHAKLRDQNNRLRQEREIMEQEREEWRDRLINTEDMQIKVTDLMEEVKKMASLVTLPPPPKIGLEAAPDLIMGERSAVKPPRRNSRANEELREALEKIKKRTEELQKVSTNTGENALGRSASFRRAISASEVNAPRTVRRNSGDPGQRWMNPQRITNYPIAPPSMILRPPPRSKSLFRKSLSLDQQLHTDMAGKIWDSGDESLNNTPYGSELSLRSRIRGQFLSPTGYESDGSVGDVSLDSRMSRMTGLSVKSRPLQSRTGSRESSVLSSADESSPSAPQVKQKKTLREKLKLTSKKKTNGVEDSRTGGLVAQVGLATLGLGDVINVKPEKDDKSDTVSIRSRISKALKKPLSRSSSADRAGSDRDIRKMKEEDLSAVKSALEKTESSKEAKESKLSAKGDKGSKKSLLGRLGGSSSGSTKELKTPKSSAPDDPVPPPIVRREEAPTAGDRMRSAGVIRQRTTVIEPRKY